MQNFPVPNKSLSGFQNFPSPSKLRWGFPDFRSAVIQKRGGISDWLGTWAKRIPLTIDSTKIDSDLTHFPVPIVLTGTDAEAVITEVGSDTKKIAVGLSDNSQLYCEIEQWDTVNDKITLWVSRSDWVISSTEDTTLYLYYDSTQANNTTYVGDPGDTAAQNIWNSDFVARYGMAQDPSGGADCIIDSTSNANHGTPGGTMLTEDLVDGQIGKALDFDGTDDAILLPSQPVADLIASNFTIQYMYNPGATSDRATWGFTDSGAVNAKNPICSYDGQMSVGNGAGGSQYLGVLEYTPIDTWKFYNIVDDGTDYLVYYNDSTRDSGATITVHPASTGDRVFAIGRSGLGGNYEDYNTGKYSEFRIFSIGLSSDWIKADYHAQTNTLLTAGTPQEYNG